MPTCVRVSISTAKPSPRFNNLGPSAGVVSNTSGYCEGPLVASIGTGRRLLMPDTGDHQVAVLNRSTVVEDAEVETIVKALQVQVDRDFEPAWGVGAQLDFLPKGEMTGWQGKWNLVVLDTSDEANALGYHDMTQEGLPLGKCFAKSDQIAGSALSVTMSHELLEMLADPSINLTALDQSDATHNRLYTYKSYNT